MERVEEPQTSSSSSPVPPAPQAAVQTTQPSPLPRPIQRPHPSQLTTPPPVAKVPTTKTSGGAGLYDKVVLSLQAHFPVLPRYVLKIVSRDNEE